MDGQCFAVFSCYRLQDKYEDWMCGTAQVYYTMLQLQFFRINWRAVIFFQIAHYLLLKKNTQQEASCFCVVVQIINPSCPHTDRIFSQNFVASFFFPYMAAPPKEPKRGECFICPVAEFVCVISAGDNLLKSWQLKSGAELFNDMCVERRGVATRQPIKACIVPAKPAYVHVY